MLDWEWNPSRVIADGGVIFSLAGEHAGLQWSGLPG
jgi:hypothetical protein